MELFREVISVYMERKEWFLELLFEHISLSVISICLAGVIGLLVGIWIAEHEKMAPFVMTITNVFYTIPSISLLGMLIPFTESCQW